MNKTTILTLALCAGLLSACTEDKAEAPAPKAEAPAAPAVKPEAPAAKADAPAAKVNAPAAQAPAMASFTGGLNAYNAHKEKQRLEAQQAEDARHASFKKADRSVPFEQYREIKDGKTLMLIYHAMTQGSLSGEVLADFYDDQFYTEKDAFKRQDRIKAIMPQVEADMAGLIDSPYYAMGVGISVESYDFDKKAFKVNGISKDGLAVSLRGSGKQFVTFVNGGEYGWLKVEDEALARKIESIRNESFGDFTAKAYFYAANAQPVGKVNAIESELTRVEIISKNGEVVGVI